MAEEISFAGVIYISSKRASRLSDYTQDYIGQLARAGLIEARRVGNLWYVLLDSLNAYKEKAGEYAPQPPVSDPRPYNSDSVVSLDGQDYISAARAAKITGYHQDYVAQLARSGKIRSRQVGNRWFVDCAALEGHKKQKDALLASVQTDSVGLATRGRRGDVLDDAEVFFTYSAQQSGALPTHTTLRSGSLPATSPLLSVPDVAQRTFQKNIIPVDLSSAQHQSLDLYASMGEIKKTGSKKRNLYRLVGLSAFTVVVVLSTGYVSLRSKSLYAVVGGNVAQPKAQLASGEIVRDALSAMASAIEDLLVREVTYARSK